MSKRGGTVSKSQNRSLQHEEEEDELRPAAELNLSDDEDADAVASSGSEEGGSSDDEADADIRHAMVDYMATAAQAVHEEQQAAARRPSVGLDADNEGDDISDGSEEHRTVDPGSDSSEDERENRNTVGDVPLEWYKDEDHIGYDKEGKKIAKSVRKDRLEQLLDRNDSKKASKWFAKMVTAFATPLGAGPLTANTCIGKGTSIRRQQPLMVTRLVDSSYVNVHAMRTIYDEYNDEEITLSKDELRMIMAIRKGQFPHVEINPFEPYSDWFTRDVEKVPFNDAPVPKRRFIPSKHEEKKIVKLVQAIRKGWLKTSDQKQAATKPEVYMLWGDDTAADAANKTAVGLAYIPPAKPKLPGHEQSYNPPAEYLPTEEEVAGYELMDPEDRPQFVPRAYKSLREVPMYSSFIKEVFERCLDLYLCPRVRRKRLHIDPESLSDTPPCTTLTGTPRNSSATLLLSHNPSSLPPSPCSSTPGYSYVACARSILCLISVKWQGLSACLQVRSGRCMKSWALGSPVSCVAWCPAHHILSACTGNRVVLIPLGIGSTPEAEAEAEQALSHALEVASSQGLGGAGPGSGPAEGQLAAWNKLGSELGAGLEICHSVAPTGNTQAVLVHQLSKGASQNPFRKNKGRVTRVLFHPAKPFFYVATQNHVRVYNLAKQSLAKRLLGGSGSITCLAIHPSGDHVLVGAEDRRLAWYDLDLSDKPYRALRYHTYAVRGAAFHRTYPLFASCADDGTAHVFHGMPCSYRYIDVDNITVANGPVPKFSICSQPLHFLAVCQTDWRDARSDPIRFSCAPVDAWGASQQRKSTTRGNPTVGPNRRAFRIC
ncbi:ribosome biogenesis protein BOP1 homolog [Haematococcus lacustris]|uniref:Ribosome biogenesis protein BOP1 homolog n=1 Tax=Haematococcus lacustris TaxID=44745 RepID=A0A699Z7M2_HAELA|nr:ribosome biogenesis protein BOP1 homolog [Haematococcus lacustris]